MKYGAAGYSAERYFVVVGGMLGAVVLTYYGIEPVGTVLYSITALRRHRRQS
jgi:hypothetical protein